jgi:Domain of unknown function (DUF4388)
MALKGNLRDFSTTQLLNLINLARKTGTLTITTKGGAAQVCFKEGKLIYATLGGQDGHVADMLHKAGKLTDEQARTIREHSANQSEKALGQMLVSAGHVTQNDIIQAIRVHMLDVVYRLFAWVEGDFRFEPTLAPAQDHITVPIDLENVIMEGSRRLKEFERLQDELPNLDMALRFTDRPDTRLRNISLSVEEWRVVSFINPRNSIKQIAQFNSMTDFQIRKIVYGMLQAGLVELVRPEGVTAPPAKLGAAPGLASARPAAPAVKRSVVNRIIDRIRQL